MSIIPGIRIPRLLSCTAIVVTVLAAAAPASMAASPLVGWWPMNEGRGQTVHDWSGQGNHGKLGSSDGPDPRDPSWASGFLFKGLAFGGDDYVRVPDSPALEPQHVTVSAFVRGASSPGKWRYIASKGASGCRASSYGLYSAKNGGLGFYISDGKKFAVSPLASTAVWNGKWHHAAGTFDGTTVRLFLDGKQIGAGTPTTLKLAYGLPQGDGGHLGGYRGSCDLLFTGRVDEVMIWNTALPIGTVRSQFRRLP